MVRYNAHGTKGNVLATAFAICSLLAVALRFIARSRTKALYAADDWLALGSLLSFYVWIAAFLWAEQNGSGYSFAALPHPVLIRYLKGAFISTITSILPITLAKLSVLYLYHRLFGQNRKLHLVILIVGLMCILWFIATTLAVALQCMPIRKAWYPSLPGHCFKFQNFMVGVEVPNSLLDFVIVGLPVNVIRKLQLPSQQKIALGFIFILGGFVGFIGIIRIAIVYNPHQIPLQRLGHWMCVQLGFAIICACLPTYRPLLPKATFSSTGVKEWFSSLRSRRGKPSKSSTYTSSEMVNSGSAKNARHNHYLNMNDENDNIFLTSAVGGQDHKVVEHDLPEHFIVVRKDVEISK